ncbi:MAG: dockerin type I repeat-containing protein, partial [Planctomycetales bacterium]|nr:dockerin type I repeat-containing protein [Planctomycetales bacterium]
TIDDRSLAATTSHDFDLPLSVDGTKLHKNFHQAIWQGRDSFEASAPWSVYFYDRTSGEQAITHTVTGDEFPLRFSAIEEYPPIELAQNAFVLEYESSTGNLSVRSQTGAEMTTVELKSASSAFHGERPLATNRTLFDVFKPNKLFSWVPYGELSIDYGPVLPVGWSAEQLRADLTINGSLLPSGGPDMGIYVVDGETSPLARMRSNTFLHELFSNYVYAETVFDNPEQRDLVFDSRFVFNSGMGRGVDNSPLVEFRFNEHEPWQLLDSFTHDAAGSFVGQMLVPAAGHERVLFRIRTGAAREPFQLFRAAMRPVAAPLGPVRVWFEVASDAAFHVRSDEQLHVYDESGDLVALDHQLTLAGPHDGSNRYYLEYDANSADGIVDFTYVAPESLEYADIPVHARAYEDRTLNLVWNDNADLTSCDFSNLKWANGIGPAISLTEIGEKLLSYELSTRLASGHYVLDLGTTPCRTTLGTEVPRYLEFDHERVDIHFATVLNEGTRSELIVLLPEVYSDIHRQVVARLASRDSVTIWESVLDFPHGGDFCMVLLPSLAVGTYAVHLDVLYESTALPDSTGSSYILYIADPESGDENILTVPGDVNVDGRFDENDLALLAELGYADEADWKHGDFDGDGRFTSADLALAFKYGWNGMSAA